MSADIVKEAVFDDRIVQSRPRYAVEKGALSLTNAPFNAIAATASQMTFNVYVPSENVYVDRALRWGAEGRFQMAVQNIQPPPAAPLSTANPTGAGYGAATPGVVPVNGTGVNGANGGVFPQDGTPIIEYGIDFALRPFPLNYLCQTMTATINDTTSVINSQDVLLEVMRLTDYKNNKKQRTCPTMMDKYQANYLANGASASINSPMLGYDSAMNIDEVPNGSHAGFYFCKPDGSRVNQYGADSYTVPGGGVGGLPTTQWFWNGIPVNSAVAAGATPLVPQTNALLYWSFYSVEKLTLSPFVFADDCEKDTGLFGINNIQLIMNFKSGSALSRILSCLFTSPAGAPLTSGDALTRPQIVPSSIQFNSAASQVWGNPVMNVQFLTPSLDVPLPPKSVVPYMEFPRYITQPQNGQLGAFGSQTAVGQIQSQTITLPQIPDLLLIYVKAQQVGNSPDPTDPSYGDGYLPLASLTNSTVKSPLSINFDNFSGLLSSHTTEELYQMSVENGLDMDYPTWCGLVHSAVPSNGAGGWGTNPPAGTPAGSVVAAQYPPVQEGQLRPTVGGFLVLKPSKDITLQSGQAPSLVGNFTLQFNLSVVNTYPFPVQPVLYVITANSGFFESIRGSSRIIKGVLSEQDIISAPVSSAQTHEGLKRLVGGRISFGSLANAFNKAKEIYEKTKPLVSEAKKLLPEGKIKGALGAVGYGTGAGEMDGGTGAGRRRGLSARLM